MIKQIFLTFLMAVGTFLLYAQEVTIRGVVLDEHSGEGIPFADVFLPKDETRGVSTDFDGNFEFRLESRPDSLEFAALGYESLVLPYRRDSFWKVKLASASIDLEEVVISPDEKEDPAYAIFRKIIENKPLNDRSNLESYSCEVYNKMEVDLINITEEFINLKINKPFRFVYEHIDSTNSADEVPYLPLFVTETLSDYYFTKDPKEQKEFVKAVKIVGDAQNESVAPLLGVAEAQLNTYDNWITLVTKKFAGPISDHGTTLYRYYLVDSAMIDDYWCYNIQYYPKHKGINGFYGNFWVDSESYAIKRIKMQLLEEGHINFVERLSILQEYTPDARGQWFPTKDYVVLSSTTIAEPFVPPIFLKKLRENAPGLQVKRRTTYRDFSTELTTNLEGMEGDSVLAADAFDKSDTYWETHRHTELEESEKTAYYLVDTIRTLPVIEMWERITSTLFTGYMWGDYVDVGNFYEFLAFNPVEGFRTKIGGRTSTGVSKKFRLGAFGAYGWKDKRFKYGADFLYLIEKSPRRALQLAYVNDYSPTPNFSPFFSSAGDGISSDYFLRRNSIPIKLLQIENISAKYHHDWKGGLTSVLHFSRRNNRPLFNFSFPVDGQEEARAYSIAEAGIELRYAFKERVVRGAYDYYSLGSQFPIISMRYDKGMEGWLGSDFDYHRLEAKISDKVRWGRFGFTLMELRGGHLWGNVPYLSTFIFEGNESLLMNFGGLNTVPEYTFAADKYASVELDHHFDGYILQVVPLFRKMKLRSVANFRMLIGDMSDGNQELNSKNFYGGTTDEDIVRIRVPSQTPFMETSFGIENILRFFRVDAIWRLNYSDLNQNRFAVRGSAHFRI